MNLSDVSRICVCCEQGDYDLVITDYTRAKSLFWVTEVQAFKKGILFVWCTLRSVLIVIGGCKYCVVCSHYWHQ